MEIIWVVLIFLFVIGAACFLTSRINSLNQIDKLREENDLLKHEVSLLNLAKQTQESSIKTPNFDFGLINDLNEKLRICQKEKLEIKDEFNQINDRYCKLVSCQQSERVRLGKVTENIVPFLQNFPYERDRVRGLFSPIDLLVFNDDEIVFIEVKTGKSVLSKKQKNIRRLVEEKKVRFETHSISEEGYSIGGEKSLNESCDESKTMVD